FSYSLVITVYDAYYTHSILLFFVFICYILFLVSFYINISMQYRWLKFFQVFRSRYRLNTLLCRFVTIFVSETVAPGIVNFYFQFIFATFQMFRDVDFQWICPYYAYKFAI